MTEDEVREIAQNFVIENSIDKGFIISIRKLSRTTHSNSSTVDDEWVVYYQFENDGSYAIESTVIIIDDSTGEPRSLNSL